MPYAGEQISRGGVKKQDEMAEGIDKKEAIEEQQRGFVIRKRKDDSVEDPQESENGVSEQPQHWTEGYNKADPAKPKINPETQDDWRDRKRRKELFGEFVPRRKK